MKTNWVLWQLSVQSFGVHMPLDVMTMQQAQGVTGNSKTCLNVVLTGSWQDSRRTSNGGCCWQLIDQSPCPD